MLHIGRAIRSLRTQLGLSQGSLAQRADLSASFLSLVESGRRAASLKVTERIAAALGVPVDVVLWESIELPAKMTERDRRTCEVAKLIVKQVLAHERGAANNSSET